MSFKRQNVPIEKIPPVIRYKWNDRAVREGVASMPKRLLRVLSRIFSGENAVERLQVVLAIADYKNPNNPYPPSWDYLAFMAGLSVGSVKARMAELESAGLAVVYPVNDRIDIKLDGLMEAVEREANQAHEDLNERVFPIGAETIFKNESPGLTGTNESDSVV